MHLPATHAWLEEILGDHSSTVWLQVLCSSDHLAFLDFNMPLAQYELQPNEHLAKDIFRLTVGASFCHFPCLAEHALLKLCVA